MSETKMRGIILREAPMGDKDKRLVMLTREMGKISVLAKGALSPKSKFTGMAQLFSYGDYVLTKGKTFYYIKEGQLLESFFPLRENLDRLTYATLIMEVAETLSLDGQENENLMRLLLRALQAMTRVAEGSESLVADAFIWRALAENGFYPDLEICRVCGKKLEPLLPGSYDAHSRAPEGAGAKRLFDFALGAVVCESCQGRGGGVYLGAGALRALRYIAEMPQEKIFSFAAEEEVQRQLDEAAIGYLLLQTEHRYKSLDFIRSLRE